MTYIGIGDSFSVADFCVGDMQMRKRLQASPRRGDMQWCEAPMQASPRRGGYAMVRSLLGLYIDKVGMTGRDTRPLHCNTPHPPPKRSSFSCGRRQYKVCTKQFIEVSFAHFSSRIENQKRADTRPFYDNIIFEQNNLLKLLLPSFLLKYNKAKAEMKNHLCLLVMKFAQNNY